MFEIYLKSPGILFVMATGKIVRTPIKFKIKKSDKQLYESLIRVSPITDYTITEIDDIVEVPKKKSKKLSITKPKLDIGLNLKIKG